MKIESYTDDNRCKYITYTYKGVAREFGRHHCFYLDILEEKFTKLDKLITLYD